MKVLGLSLLSLLLLISSGLCQNGLEIPEETSQDSANEDVMGEQDPNILNPQNHQGYGRDIPDQITETKPLKISKKDSKKTIAEQTIQAVLQFGVLVAVAFMVGFLFMLNIGVELVYDKVRETFSSIFCSRRVQAPDEPDPADLVGTFKRYK